MLYYAKNLRLPLGGAHLDAISFGSGPEALVMLPGLGDGLQTVRGAALPFALQYRAFAARYRVFVFSRPDPLPSHCTTRQMAADLYAAMQALGIARAHVLGVSQGGMIAQYLAIDHPDSVQRLVLAVTAGRSTPELEQAVGRWITLAQAGDHKALMIDTAERSYTEAYFAKTHYRLLYPLLGFLGRPKSYARFLTQARACLHHNALPELGRITAPTLVIGGGADRVLGPSAAGALAGAIPGSECFLYQALGHAAYEEAPDFNDRVLQFLH